jgi:hypothetical protein
MGILTNLFKTKYLGILDIEFQINQDKNGKQNAYILELGIVIYEKNNDIPIYINHVNFPLLKDTNLRVLNTKYCTTTEDTERKIKEIEKEFQINLKDIESIKNKSELISFIPDKNTKKKLKEIINTNQLNYTEKEYIRMQKIIDKLSFNLFKNRLPSKYKVWYNKIINLYLNDPSVKQRTINPKNYLEFLRNYFKDITIIHKEDMDFIAINNDLRKYDVKVHNSVSHYDIADHNQLLIKKYETAKLYESYLFLKRDYIDNIKYPELKKFDEILREKLKEKMPVIKAHNPLSDTYFTIIVFIIIKKYFNLK